MEFSAFQSHRIKFWHQYLEGFLGCPHPIFGPKALQETWRTRMGQQKSTVNIWRVIYTFEHCQKSDAPFFDAFELLNAPDVKHVFSTPESKNDLGAKIRGVISNWTTLIFIKIRDLYPKTKEDSFLFDAFPIVFSYFLQKSPPAMYYKFQWYVALIHLYQCSFTCIVAVMSSCVIDVEWDEASMLTWHCQRNTCPSLNSCCPSHTLCSTICC